MTIATTCTLCGSPSDTGRDHQWCEDAERHHRQQTIEQRVNDTLARWATQCIICGHVEDPNDDPDRCPRCSQIGSDVRAFPATTGAR